MIRTEAHNLQSGDNRLAGHVGKVTKSLGRIACRS